MNIGRDLFAVSPWFWALVLSALTMFVPTTGAAEGRQDFVPPPSRWGPDDELGNLNYVTPAKVLQAAKLVKTGMVIDLGTEYYEGMPTFGGRNYKAWLLTHAAITPFGREQTTLLEEYVTMSTGIGTQLDGFAHVGSNHVFYNRTSSEDIIDAAGAKKFGMGKVPPIVARGVLIDMVACKGRYLEGGERITVKDFEACMKKQGTALESGDAVLIHTGWMRWLGVDDEKFMATVPGIDIGVSRYLVGKGVVGVGTDQWTTDVLPYGEDFVIPSHVILLTNGVYLFQNLRLEELAQKCAKEGRYQFFFSFTHPKLKGTVQGIGQPIAIM